MEVHSKHVAHPRLLVEEKRMFVCCCLNVKSRTAFKTVVT